MTIITGASGNNLIADILNPQETISYGLPADFICQPASHAVPFGTAFFTKSN
ncbi:MAG: hypothetical protein IKN94_03605 [Salinivirgaceae bacterium]|nr:hypothetical protein [Salinivirgaceae bacterium]